MITYKKIDESSLDFIKDALYCDECGCENVNQLQEEYNEENNSYRILCWNHSEEIIL
jgi:hypothetical protein